MNKAENVYRLHADALSYFAKLEIIIDDLKRIESREELNALPNIEGHLRDLANRANVEGSPYKRI